MADLVPLDSLLPAQPQGGDQKPAVSQRQGTISLDSVLPKTGQAGIDQTRMAGDRDLAGYNVPPRAEGASMNYTSALNQTIARFIGAPADLGASILEPKMWNDATEEQRQSLRERSPYQSAFMDFLAKASADPTLGHKWVERLMASGQGTKVAGVDLGIRTDVQPTNMVERMAQAAGHVTGETALPGLGAEAVLARSWRVGKAMFDSATKSLMESSILNKSALPTTVADILKGGGFSGNVAVGAGAGAGGEAAQEMVPDKYKPLAETAGSFVGGGVGAAASAPLESLFKGALQKIGRLFEGTNQGAARQITDAASNPEAVRTSAANTPATPEENRVPGSEPTLFQDSGDLGVGMLERNAAKDTPYGVEQFAQRRADQNNARAAMLDKLAAPDADPADVTKYIRSQLRDMEDHFDYLKRGSERNVDDRLQQAGGDLHENPSAYGDALRDPLDAIHTQEKDAASRLWRAIDPDLDTPVYFKTMKRYFDRLETEVPDTAKQPGGEEKAIYELVRGLPDETSFGNIVALRSRLTDAIRDERREGTPSVLRRLSIMLRGVDNSLAVVAGDVAKDPAKRSDLVNALRAEAEEWQNQQMRSGAYGQRQAVGAPGTTPPRAGGLAGEGAGGEDQLGFTGQGTVPPAPRAEGPVGGGPGVVQGGEGVQGEAAAVIPPAGEPAVTPPGGKIEDRFVAQAKEQDRGSTLTKEQANGAPTVYAGVKRGQDPEGNVFISRSQAKAEQMAGVDGEAVPFRLRPGSTVYPDMAAGFGTPDGRQSLLRGRKDDSLGIVHVDELEAAGGVSRGITPEISQRYSAARGATREMKETLESGAVGRTLRPAGDRGSFKTTAANVARGLFDSPERLDQFTAAAEKGTPEQRKTLLDTMADYAAFSMRKFAVKDGEVSGQRLRQWVADHGYVFDRFPELREKFESLGSAKQALDETLARQKASLADFQDSAASEFIGGREPEKVVGGALRNPEEFGKLVDSMRGNQSALEGLKRATVENMMAVGRGTSTAEAGTSGEAQLNGAAIQKFYAANREALSKLFSREEMANMEAVVLDIQRANRSIAALRIPGGSNTAQDTSGRVGTALQYAMTHYGGKAVGVAAGAAAGMHHGVGGYLGAAAGLIGGAAVDSLVASKGRAIDKAVVDMMLDRNLAHEWLSKIPEEASPTTGERFARRLRVLTATEVERQMGRAAGNE